MEIGFGMRALGVAAGVGIMAGGIAWVMRQPLSDDGDGGGSSEYVPMGTVDGSGVLRRSTGEHWTIRDEDGHELEVEREVTRRVPQHTRVTVQLHPLEGTRSGGYDTVSAAVADARNGDAILRSADTYTVHDARSNVLGNFRRVDYDSLEGTDPRFVGLVYDGQLRPAG
jgi:hypothetical protein